MLEKRLGSWDFACGQLKVDSSTAPILAVLTKQADLPILAALNLEDPPSRFPALQAGPGVHLITTR
jgi:hypothetical protein